MANLSVPIRLELGEYRPVLVDSKKALFHGWGYKTDGILKFDYALKPDDRLKKQREFLNFKCVDHGCSLETIPNIIGLVEFEDGHMEMTKPEDIKFLDTGDKFKANEPFFYGIDESHV